MLDLVNWIEKVSAEYPGALLRLRIQERGFRIAVCCRLQTDGSARTILPAEPRRATEKGDEETVARPRYQEGHLRKRGKGKPVWVGCFREDAMAEDGLRLRRQRSVVLGPLSELSKREAQQRLSERLAAINQRRHKPELMMSFERFVLERWEPSILPTLRYSTARNYRHLIRRHLLPFFGAMRLPEIGPADVQMFLAEKSKRFAPWTVHALRYLLSKIFGTAQQWGYLQINATERVLVPALVDMRERITLTPEQLWALLRELKEPYRTMVLLAVASGLRCGEVFGLRWKYVDFAERSIAVAESAYEGRVGPPKTRASKRKVFVPPMVMEALVALRPQSFQRDDFVFHSERGTPLNPNNVRNRILGPACKRAGVPQIGWRNLRYTYATWANPSGESIKALQTQMGHTDSRLTLSVYTQPMPEAQQQLASKIERVLLSNAAKFGVGPDGSGGLIQ